MLHSKRSDAEQAPLPKHPSIRPQLCCHIRPPTCEKDLFMCSSTSMIAAMLPQLHRTGSGGGRQARTHSAPWHACTSQSRQPCCRRCGQG